MPTLASPLRRKLENAIKQARKIAEAGARKALEALAVHDHYKPGKMCWKTKKETDRVLC